MSTGGGRQRMWKSRSSSSTVSLQGYVFFRCLKPSVWQILNEHMSWQFTLTTTAKCKSMAAELFGRSIKWVESSYFSTPFNLPSRVNVPFLLGLCEIRDGNLSAHDNLAPRLSEFNLLLPRIGRDIKCAAMMTDSSGAAEVCRRRSFPCHRNAVAQVISMLQHLWHITHYQYILACFIYLQCFYLFI